MMQNHYVISSKYHFWTRNVPNWTKTLTSVMSGPVQEDKYLLQTSGNTFIFSDFTPFHFLWPVLTSKQRIFFFDILHLSIFISKFVIFWSNHFHVSLTLHELLKYKILESTTMLISAILYKTRWARDPLRRARGIIFTCMVNLEHVSWLSLCGMFCTSKYIATVLWGSGGIG